VCPAALADANSPHSRVIVPLVTEDEPTFTTAITGPLPM
jgi:hypothetical protein